MLGNLRTRALVGVVALVGSAATTVGIVQTAHATAATIAVPITVTTQPNGGLQTIVNVRVGNSPALPVILDTGSSGLHIFADKVPTGTGSGVNVTSTPANITYAGGHRFVGVVANAKVQLGSAPTSHAVPVALVKNASCIPSKPTCPARDGIAGMERKGIDGILGIGLSTSKGPVASPILGLAGSLGTRWSIHLGSRSGTLLLGAPLPAAANRAATIPMKRTGTFEGHALWADSALRLCVHAGNVATCAPSLFDTGTAAMQLQGPRFAALPTSNGTQLVSGLPVTFTLPGATKNFWSFTTGATRSKNLVVLRAGTGNFVNLGVQGYVVFTMSYDDSAGAVVAQPVLDPQAGRCVRILIQKPDVPAPILQGQRDPRHGSHPFSQGNSTRQSCASMRLL